MESNKALRYNSGKIDFSLLDFKSLIPMIDVLEYGKVKYTVYDDEGKMLISGANNWKKEMHPEEILKSMLRHITSMSDGELLDNESGLPHIGHVMCNAMFYIYHSKIEYDRTNIQNRALAALQSYTRTGNI